MKMGAVTVVDWTRQQKEAIETRGSHLLVSAAAGSGKTAVLVARILDMMIKERIDIDQMLIVTFTHAAAAEMREKILGALIKLLDENKSDLEKTEFIRRQINRLNRASIQTLHGFCIEVIRAGFHVIDVDPEFRIADDLERSMLRDQAIEEIMEDYYSERVPEFLNLIEAFSNNKDDQDFKNTIKKFHSFAKSMPEPWEWMKDSISLFGQPYEEFKKGEWMSEIKGQLAMELDDIYKEYGELVKTAEMPDGPSPYLHALGSDGDMVEKLIFAAEKDIEDYYHVYSKEVLENPNPVFEKFKAIRKADKESMDIEKIEKVKNGRNKLKKRILDLRKKYVDCQLKKAYGHMRELKPDIECLASLVKKLDERYLYKKAERRLMDFNDLEHFALDILKDERMAGRFRGKYRQIFIDEYQDNNRMQEAIIGMIASPDNIFMVGDVKQSIYRFRLAEPGIFISKYLKYGREKTDGKRIVLNKNFRSRETILEAINFVFTNIMNENTGEIQYDNDAKLNPGKDFLSERAEAVEIHMLEKLFNAGGEMLEEEISELNHSQAEAVLTARLIKRLLNEKTYDAEINSYRPIEYRDIVILSRAAKNWADVFYEILSEEGIPVYTEDSGGYFDTLEIKLLVDLLKLIDNSRQDLPLLSVLRSPAGGFSIDEMTQIRLAYQSGSYHEALYAYMMEKTDKLSIKINEFYSKLEKWSKKSQYMKLDDFIWTLSVESGYMAYISAMPGGIRRRENLKVLMDRASALSKGTCGSLFEFIRFIEDVLKSRGDMDTAAVLGEKDNVVRMMTVHKSKGLEFPVVIMTGIGKKMKRNVSKNDLLLHRDLGIGPKHYDIQKRVYGESLPQKAIKLRSFRESVAEEMRILYVAMTRASDRLMLVGSVRNAEKEMTKWAESMTDYSILDSNSFLDWIMGPVSTMMNETDKLAAQNGREVRLSGQGHNWRIMIHDRSTLSKGIPEAFDNSVKERVENLDFEADRELIDRIEKTLSWSYTYAPLVEMPSKMTVTLLNRFDPGKENSKIGFTLPALSKAPAALSLKKEATPAEIGDMYHVAMRNIVFDSEVTENEKEIEKQINEMIEKDILAPDSRKYIDLGKIKGFIKSSLGQRIMAAENVNREVPFVLSKGVEEIIEVGKTLRGKDKLLIQGIIDCYFEEDGEWVLLDYKTGSSWKKGLENAADTYRIQLNVYREALEKITCKKVKEAYLFFIDAGEEVRIL